MEAKWSYTKAALAFSITSLLIGVFAVLDACLSPVTWRHCHGDRGLSNHLCNDPYSPEGRRRDGGAEGGGGWNESRASKSRGREGGGERGRKGRGAAEQSSRDPDRNKKEKENRFSFYWQQGKNLLCFYITNRTLSKGRDRENSSLRNTGIQEML